MKKAVFLLPVLLLSSCTFAGTVTFKNNLYFDEKITDPGEIADFYEFTESTIEHASKLELDATGFSRYGYHRAKSSSHVNAVFFTNGYSMKTVTKTKNKDSGLVLKDNYTIKTESFVMNLTGKNKNYLFVDDTREEKEKYTAVVVDKDEKSSIGLMQIFTYLGFGDTSLSVYKKGSSYSIVYSSKTKFVQDEQAGNKVKQFKTITERQLIVNVDSAYRLTKATYFYKVRTNKDPDTSEWYSSVKTISKAKVKLTLKYDTQKARTQSELMSKLDGRQL